MSLNASRFMLHSSRRLVLASVLFAMVGMGPAVHAQNDAVGALDIGTSVPDVASVKEGLFPEDACQELRESGFKCMGFKPAINYSLAASSFALGSAEVPPLLRRQLDVFAEVLQGKSGAESKVRIVGHADASGSQAGNLSLSKRRAEAVREYLIQKGVSPELLIADGLGAQVLKNKADPFSAENRRVEIGRTNPPR
jgi:OmpA-OmpF porin, OOP family